MATGKKARRAQPAAVVDTEGPMAGYIPMREWVALYGPPLYPTWDSLDWFIRNHPAQLKGCPHFMRAKNKRYMRPEFAQWLKDYHDSVNQQELDARARTIAKRADAKRARASAPAAPKRARKGGKGAA